MSGLDLAAEPRSSRNRTEDQAPIVVVGLSASHDASACLMINGIVRHAVQLERITRRKHDGAPYLSTDQAVDYCLGAANLTRDDVDLYAFNAQPLYPGRVGLSEPLAARDFTSFEPLAPNVRFVSHHLCHAFAAYLLSDRDEAAVLVMDGSGGSVAGADDVILNGPELARYVQADGRAGTALPALHVMSIYRFGKTGYELLHRETAPSFNVRHGSSSIGECYAAVAQFIFGSWQASGKVMGLAPYGEAGGRSFLEKREGHTFSNFRSDWKNDYRAGGRSDALADWSGLAAIVQGDLERAVCERIAFATRLTGIGTLCYSGGIALNCKANQQAIREGAAERLMVFPASSDAGIAIGAAAAATFIHTGETLRTPDQYHEFLGYPYQSSDHSLAIEHFLDRLTVQPVDLDDVADRIAAGAAIGWFEGGSEFGPRALGHRSILSDPRDAGHRDRINADIKYREDFRPFAPMALLDDAATWFEIDAAYPFMTETVDVRPEYRSALPAITHLDGTARLQTVTDAEAPRIARLLRLIRDRTGFSVLINTSLNMRGQPIVETPIQAVEFLLSTRLDAMVLGDHLLQRIDPFTTRNIFDHHIVLAPDIELSARLDADGMLYSLGSAMRDCSYVLSHDLFVIIEHAAGKGGSLRAAAKARKVRLSDGMRHFLSALLAETLLLVRDQTDRRATWREGARRPASNP
jgi:carbamoyltransferase